MSYLTRPSVLFAGSFRADVPTANNLWSYYADPPGDVNTTGLNWNPHGGGAFRLLDCAVHHVLDDTPSNDPADPIHRAVVRGAHDRVSAKIVDLDTQYQGASELWGLRVEIVADGVVLLAGEFEPAGFRDFWTPVPRVSRHYQARYQSVLRDVTWAPAGTSATIDRLRATSSSGLLSIRMTTHGFSVQGTTLGRLAGAVGPYLLGEPRRFVAGRRFPETVLPPPPPGQPPAQPQIGAFDVEWSPGDGRLTLDLATALAWQADPPSPVGPLRLAVLTDPDIEREAVVAFGATALALGEPLSRTDGTWLAETGGVVEIEVPAGTLRDTVSRSPLALVRDTTPPTVLVRETADGWLVRADDENHRVDAHGRAVTRLHVSQYGTSVPDVVPLVAVQPSDPPDPASPGPHPPTTGAPEGLVTPGEVAPTDRDGWTSLTLDCGDPGRPRSPIEGQIYFVLFAVRPAPVDFLVVLVFDHYPEPPNPTWEDDVRDILAPYAALYPAMTASLFDLSDYDHVRDRRAMMQLALSLDVSDPNSMPVTRDLSGPKRRTLLRWLALPDLPHRPDDTVTADVVAPAPPRDPDPVPPDAPVRGKAAADAMRLSVLEEGTL